MKMAGEVVGDALKIHYYSGKVYRDGAAIFAAGFLLCHGLSNASLDSMSHFMLHLEEP